MSEDLSKLFDIVDQAMQLAAEDRISFVEKQCGRDSRLAEEAKRMIRSADNADEYFASPANEAADVLDSMISSESEATSIPDAIGKYQVIRRLGKGGMGDVFLATVRLGAIDREVAIKVVKRGMDTDAVVARFKAEGNILASLSHPNIARLIDSGTTEGGRAYFVMDYIDGLTVTEFCDIKKMPISDRLSLFEKICHAVHYAHQNLVVHRDLKPSNILVTPTGEIKLLDFGIAKLLESPEDYTAPVTATGQRFYTADYASPEQLAGKGLTTATDVYSLGVILYEILSGTRPFKSKMQSPAEFLTSVMMDVPRKPSIALAAVNDKNTEEILESRSLSIGGLQSALQGELDTIILKAIRKSPEDRYASAEQLREDIRRYQDGLPIVARPATVAYRVRKFYGRHKLGMVASVGAVFSVVALTTVYISQINVQRTAAERSADRANAVTDFVVGLFEQSTRIDGSTNDEHVKASLLLLNPALDELEKLENSPVAKVEILNIFGRVLKSNVSAERSIEVLSSAMEISKSTDIPLDVRSETWLGLAHGYFRVARYDSAYYYAEKAFVGFGETLGDDYPSTLESYKYMAWPSHHVFGHYEMFDEAVEKYESVFGEESVELADLLNEIGQGYPEKGVEYFERALDIYALHDMSRSAGAGITMANLSLMIEGEEPDRGLELQVEAAQILESALGRVHPQTLGTLSNIGAMYVERAMYAKADDVYTDYNLRNASLSSEVVVPHPIASFWHARAKLGLGQYTEAAELLAPELDALAYDDYRYLPLLRVYLRAVADDGKKEEGQRYINNVVDSLRALDSIDSTTIEGLYKIVE